MRVENGVLMYERSTCRSCDGKGQWVYNHPCPRYDKPQNGKPCPLCGSKTRYNHRYLPDDHESTCRGCNGTKEEMETRYSSMPVELVRAIPIVVIHSDRGITWNESYLGLGCLWSVVDYGEHKELDGGALTAKVRADMHMVQATAVVDDQDRIPPFIAVCCNRSGYSVRSAWKVPQLLREWDEATGLAVGMAVYQAGGHGTLAAAIGRPTSGKEEHAEAEQTVRAAQPDA